VPTAWLNKLEDGLASGSRIKLLTIMRSDRPCFKYNTIFHESILKENSLSYFVCCTSILLKTSINFYKLLRNDKS